MASNDSQIDWAKAAAAWASQRREGVLPNPVPPSSRPQHQSMPFRMMPSAFYMGSPAYAVPGLHPLSGAFPPQMGNGLSDGATVRPLTPVTQLPGSNVTAAQSPFFNVSTFGATAMPPTGNMMFGAPAYTHQALRPNAVPFSGAPETAALPQQQPYSTKVSTMDRSGCLRADPVLQTSAAPAIPQWLKEAAQTAGAAAAQTSTIQSPPNLTPANMPRDGAEAESALLTPTNDLPLDAISSTDDAEASKEHLAAVKDKVTHIILRATDVVLDEVIQEMLQEQRNHPQPAAHFSEAQRPVAVSPAVLNHAGPLPVPPANLSSGAITSHPFLAQQQGALATHPMHTPLLTPSQPLHPGMLNQSPLHHPGAPLIMAGAPSAPLHLQFPPASLGSRRSYGPPVPDPTLEVDEEIVDERDATDNGGMPFINPEEPTKGLFRSPPDGLVLPECKPTNNEVTASEENVVADGAMSDATVVFQKPAKYEEPYVEVVTYSKDGEVLGRTVLNGRKCLVIGSNPKQAHILDSHTSVYSQHCALAVCSKGKVSLKSNLNLQPCALFLFPLGGSTKLLKPEQVPFIRQKKMEEEEKVDVEQDGVGDEENCDHQRQNGESKLNVEDTVKGVSETENLGDRPATVFKETDISNKTSLEGQDEASGGPLSNNVALGGSIAAPSQPVQPHDQVLGEERAAEEESHGGQKRALTPPVLPLPKINKPVDPTAGAEVLTDAGRKREVPVNTQLDETKELVRFRSSASVEREQATIEERERRRESDPCRNSRSRSLSSVSSFRRHSRRRRDLSRSTSAVLRSRDGRDSRREASGRRTRERHERSVSRSPRYARHHRSRHRHHHRHHRYCSSSSYSPKSGRRHEKRERDNEISSKRQKSSSNEGYASDRCSRRRKYRND